MESLYGRLYKFRERPRRGPLEPFLTEALADLLNRMPPLEMSELVSKFFLPPAAQDAWQELVKSSSGDGLQWIAHRSIYVGTSVQYPDFILYAGDEPLVIVENKIASGIGTHEEHQSTEDNNRIEDDTPLLGSQAVDTFDQVASYGRWLSAHCKHAWPGAIAFLTHFTLPPAGFGMGDRKAYGVEWQRICRWRDVWAWLTRVSYSSSDSSISTWRALAAELAEFLAEKSMNAESITFYDISAAEIFIKSAARHEYTFKQIRDSLSPQWPGMGWSATTRGHILYESKGGILWDWMYLRSPHSPANRPDWYIAWGIRFPELSDRWKGADPSLPLTNHVFVLLSSDKTPLPPVSSQQVRERLAGSWSVVPDWGIVTGRALYEFSSEASPLGDEVIKWIAAKTGELRSVLPQLVQLTSQQQTTP